MKQTYLFVLIVLFVTPLSAFSNISLSHSNCWKTPSEQNGKVISIVKTWKNGTSFHGKIIKTFKVKGLPYQKYCTKCRGSYRNQPIQGMSIIWGGKEYSPSRWTHLRILEPLSGNIYKATISLLNNGTKLKVRGYIGLPIFGRTQIWLRTRCPQHA